MLIIFTAISLMRGMSIRGFMRGVAFIRRVSFAIFAARSAILSRSVFILSMASINRRSDAAGCLVTRNLMHSSSISISSLLINSSFCIICSARAASEFFKDDTDDVTASMAKSAIRKIFIFICSRSISR